MLGTMQDFPLTIAMLLRHGAVIHAGSEVVTFEGDTSRRASFSTVATRAELLAAALRRLGVQAGDRVGTFCWNTQEHLEAYLAIPTLGAVLHTLNIRLFPQQLAYVVNHAGDRVVIVADGLVPVLARVAPELGTVERYVVVGDGDASALADAVPGAELLRYEDLLASESPGFAWPDLDERRAAATVPRSLMEAFERRHGVRIVQAWGMTETSPLAAVAHPPKRVAVGGPDELDWRARTGRPIPGVELRIVDDDGTPLPWDGRAVGEIEVRGPWVTGSYHRDAADDAFHDGWLRTGDVGSVDPDGYVQITDRAKDVIKSGGEWISSVELENHLMAHPAVREAAVIGVVDPRWGERPLACVVVAGDAPVGPEELRSFLGDRVARWQVPERWALVAEIPKTSVGKFDKKVLRARHEAGELDVQTVG